MQHRGLHEQAFWIGLPKSVLAPAMAEADRVFTELRQSGKNIQGAGADSHAVFIVALARRGVKIPAAERPPGMESVLAQIETQS